MGSNLTLKDLTKAELLELLDKYVFSVSNREIIRVRYNSLIRKAGAASAEAMTDMTSLDKDRGDDQKTTKNTAEKKYDQAMRLIHQAEKLRSMTEAFRPI